MKKTLKFFAVALAAIFCSAMVLTSCGDPNEPDNPDNPNNPGTDNPVDTTSTTHPDVDYTEVTADNYIVSVLAYGETKNGYHFNVQIQDKSILSFLGAIVGGSGDIYNLDIYSKTADNLVPAMTEYAIGKTTAPYMVKGSAQGGSKVKLVDENDDAKRQGVDVEVSEGYVSFEKKGANYRICVNVKLSDGTSRAIAYTGAVSFKDEGPYSKESDEKVTSELTGVQMEISNAGSQVNQETDVINIQMYGTNGEGVLWLLVPKGEKNLIHNYEINNSGKAWTVYASEGMKNGNPSPSYVVMIVKPYFLTGGTLDVTADGMKMNATTVKGSTITIDYKGSVKL